MALVEGLGEEFADHDVFLHLLLGLVSAARRSERLLPPPPPAPPTEPAMALEEEQERRVMALLGLVSVRRTLLGTLEAARVLPSVGPGPRPSPAPGGLPSGFELLR